MTYDKKKYKCHMTNDSMNKTERPQTNSTNCLLFMSTHNGTTQCLQDEIGDDDDDTFRE